MAVVLSTLTVPVGAVFGTEPGSYFVIGLGLLLVGIVGTRALRG